MKKIALTLKELESLLTLVSIAVAGPEGEGDYQDFDYKSMDSAQRKLIKMRDGLES